MWISVYLKFSVNEEEEREETVILHELAGHIVLSEISAKVGGADSIPAILSTVKQKVHPPVLGKMIAA